MKRSPLAFALALSLALSACRSKTPPAPAPTPTTVVLLPDSDGHTGAIHVSNAAGSVDLNQPYTTTRLTSANAAPAPVGPISQADVQRLFGSALGALPTPEATFDAFFETGQSAIRDEDRALLLQVVQAIKDRASTDVAVVGHADATGTHALNYELALRRAHAVAQALQDLGVDPAIISVESQGDENLTVKTRQGVRELRNRRVEIDIR